ncbi:MAG: peptide/nickel transport system permease protein [Motiliproteus sp.]|jgi:peptide/nickel transport system permease protein
MWLFLLKRSVLALLIIVLAVTALYLMIHAIPGDPASIILGPRATEEMKAALYIKMGLDQPIYIQVLSFFGNILQGDLGYDFFSKRDVTEIIGEQLPWTLALIFSSVIWAALIGIPLGCYSAVYANTWFDTIAGVLSVSTIAIPSFVVAIYSLLIFSVTLQWLPAIGPGESGDILSQLEHLVLPAFAVGLGWVGYISRLVRASMLEVLGSNHIRTAKAFGLPTRWIIFRYALRLAILPTVTLLGVGIGYLLSASLFAEIVFARPGIGKLIFDAVSTRNYPVVMGCVLVTTGLFVVATTFADFINALLDPRIRAQN